MPETKIKFSIVMPVYNSDAYLERAIESVLNQPYDDLELICIDNASTDMTPDILKNYQKQDKRVHIYTNFVNKGISFSRNLGIRMASGDYIFFVDSDDAMCPGALQTLSLWLVKGDVDILLFDAYCEYENQRLEEKFSGTVQRRNLSVVGTGIMSGGEMFSAFVHNSSYNVSLWRQLFRRDFLIKNHIVFQGEAHEDNLFSFMAIHLAEKARCIPDALYTYYRREGSMTTAEDCIESYKGYIIAYAGMMEFWNQIKGGKQRTQMIDAADYLGNVWSGIVAQFKRYKELDQIKFDDPWQEYFHFLLMNEQRAGLSLVYHFDVLKDFERYIIYGAGRVAKRLLNNFYSKDIVGIAVSDMKGNGDDVFGIPVRPIECYEKYKNDALIIVAVGNKAKGEIIRTLEDKGFKHILTLR